MRMACRDCECAPLRQGGGAMSPVHGALGSTQVQKVKMLLAGTLMYPVSAVRMDHRTKGEAILTQLDKISL